MAQTITTMTEVYRKETQQLYPPDTTPLASKKETKFV